MGVKFKDITEPEPIEMNELKGKVLTVDAANLIYKFLSTIRQGDGTPLKDLNGNITSHLSGIFFQTSTLIGKKVKPVYVFDGKAPKLKEKTQQERIEIKKESEKKFIEAKEAGDLESARKYAARTVHLDKKTIESSKKLLDLMGIPYVQANTEGEAQASYMVSNNDAWAVVSQDYDCLQFGAPRMLKNFKLSGRSSNMEIISLEKTLNSLNLTREQLIDLAMLVGTDFNEGVYGIGAKKGLKLIQKYGTLEKSLEHLGKTIEVDPDDIREIFLKPDLVTDYKLDFKPPKKQKLIDFLCGDHDFSEERVEASIKKLQKETAQTNLNQWF